MADNEVKKTNPFSKFFEKKVKVSAFIEMPLDEIESYEKDGKIIDLYEDKIKERSKLLTRKRSLDANVINKDIVNITSVILKNYEKYKEEMINLLSSKDYDVRMAAAVYCIRTNTIKKTALESLKGLCKDKSFGLNIYKESRVIVKLYNEGNIPPYKGFEE